MPTKSRRSKPPRDGRPPDPADPTTWKVTIEVDPTPRTAAQDRAWGEFWRHAVAELQRRRAARN